MLDVIRTAAEAVRSLNDALREEGFTLKHVTHIEGVWYCGLRDSSGNYYGGTNEPDPLSALHGALAQARRGPQPAKRLLAKGRATNRGAKRPVERAALELDLDLDDLL